MAEHELNKIVDDDGEVFNLRDSTKQPTADRVTAWGSTPSDTKYPSEKLVKTSLDAKLSYLDATYIRNNAAGDGWVKLANIDTAYRSTLDIFGVWDVLMTTASGGIWRDSVTLDVRFGSGGSLPTISLFNRLCEITNKTSQFEICVKVEGLGGSGNSTVELWAKVPKGWYCIGIRETGASVSTGLSKKLIWEYHSYTTDGGSSKPVADASNNIQVKDPDIYSRDALIQKVEFTQPAEYKSFVIIEDVTRWYDPAGTAAISKGYQLIGQIAYWRPGGGYESMAVAFIKFHLNYRWQLTNDSCCEVKSTLPNNSFCPMIIRDARDENNVKYYFGLRTKIVWSSTVQFIGRTKDLSFSNLEWIPGENAAHTGNGTEFPVGITIERNCDLLEWNSIANGGTGATTAIGAEYNILNQVADIDTTIDGNRKIALCNQTKSASNGVFRWLKLSNVWTWIKGLLSSESGVNISGSSASCTGNAATATALSAGADRTKLDGIASGAEVNVQSDWNQATTTADDYIKNKPTLGTASAKDVPTSGNASATQVVMGNDSRLTDARTPTAHTHTADAADVVDQPGDSAITDSTDIITTHVNGYSSTNKKLYRRNFKDYVWPWIKDKISSVLGLSTTGYTGNAATATKATQDSDGNAINATYFKSSGNTTLVAGAATKIGTQNGADVKLTLPAQQDISGKMATDCSNKASGALQNLTAQLTEGTYDFTDNTEMFTSYAGNNGFAESGHVNQPYRRKASSMLNYIESKRFYTLNPAQDSVGTGTKRIQLGYALKSGAGYCNYLVHVFFNSVAGSLTGCGVTLLVNYDWNTTSQKAKCVILNDNGLRAAGYNIVLANFLSNDGTNQWMHITLGLVNNSAPGTLVAFTYSYCGIFRVNSDVNWVPSIASDTVGSYDQLVQAVLTDADTVDGYHIQFGSYSSRSDTISFY